MCLGIFSHPRLIFMPASLFLRLVSDSIGSSFPLSEDLVYIAWMGHFPSAESLPSRKESINDLSRPYSLQ